jgi:propanediol dehydratase small subunit
VRSKPATLRWKTCGSQDVILGVYELLRPGRAKGKADLLEAAKLLRDTYKAEQMAAFIEEAAQVYERRGLFSKRF